MDENHINSNKNSGIKLARNTPVALVVGAAGFIGSHVTDKLLDKGIQVIGVDDLSTGERNNLELAVKDRNFHPLFEDARSLSLYLERLDYIFIVAGGHWKLDSVLGMAKEHKSKLTFVSSIELYDKESTGLDWYKKAESEIASFASENKLNARVVRLTSVYGPRMHFQGDDPIIRLIETSLKDNLQKGASVLDFSTRAIYIDDASELIIKSMFTGSTALKIFDGSLLSPIKVSEIYQILMDPLWHENRGFNPSELPPWPTPNLEKTMQILSWYPKANLVEALRETLAYLKDHGFKERKEKEEVKKSEIVEQVVSEVPTETEKKVEGNKTKKGTTRPSFGGGLPKINLPYNKISTLLVIALVFYALIFPFLQIGWGVYSLKSQLTRAATHLEKGEFDKSLNLVDQVKSESNYLEELAKSLQVAGEVSMFKDGIVGLNEFSKLIRLSADGSRHTILASKEFYQSLKAISGEVADNPQKYLAEANLEFVAADENLSQAKALLKDNNFETRQPLFLKGELADVEGSLNLYEKLVSNGRILTSLLPQITAAQGKKSYLVLIQNNLELRPGGGVVEAVARLDFEGGKLKKVEVLSTDQLDSQLSLDVTPPAEISTDLGEERWLLKDVSFEPDFPTNAKQAEWFYHKQTGILVDGVVALDITSLEGLLKIVGEVKLANESVSSDNLADKLISRKENSKLLANLTSGVLSKIFFLPNPNWPGISSILDRSLTEKHLVVYLSDPKLFSFIVTQGFAGNLPRGGEGDFLTIIEANFGKNLANFFLERKYSLETAINQGQVNHKLRISYTNGPEVYKNRLKIYLPLGSKLNKVLWGDSEITSQATSFADYGKTGYSLLLTLDAKASKSLLIDYSLPNLLTFKDNKASYRLDIFKQTGTLRDPFSWTILSPTQETVETNLSTDRRFERVFER